MSFRDVLHYVFENSGEMVIDSIFDVLKERNLKSLRVYAGDVSGVYKEGYGFIKRRTLFA